MIESAHFGFARDGSAIEKVTLANSSEMSAEIVTHGATIVSIRVPDADGRFANVVLNRRNLAEYETAGGHYGATIGRFANRIANGRFTLEGKSYQVSVNRPPNTLHGGFKGFDKRIWSIESTRDDERVSAVVLRYVSADGEEGFPGRLTIDVTFSLGRDNALTIDYSAITDASTIVNFTNHSYFNLTGNASQPVAQHELAIAASEYTPVDETQIPTGEIAAVEGTGLDFRTSRPIGEKGYDFNWVLSRTGSSGEPIPAARAYDPQSGRVLDVSTTQPGVQFYSAPGLNGFALETQHFPDSPNHQNFPSTELRPGKRFASRTVFCFKIMS